MSSPPAPATPPKRNASVRTLHAQRVEHTDRSIERASERAGKTKQNRSLKKGKKREGRFLFFFFLCDLLLVVGEVGVRAFSRSRGLGRDVCVQAGGRALGEPHLFIFGFDYYNIQKECVERMCCVGGRCLGRKDDLMTQRAGGEE